MTWVHRALVYACGLAVLGTSGPCRFRLWQFEYGLSECPEISVALPERVTWGEWEIYRSTPDWACDGFIYYAMAHQKARQGGGWRAPPGAVFYAGFSKAGQGCALQIVPILDQADPNPEARARPAADIAASALLIDAAIKAKLPAKTFQVIGGKDEFAKWCARIAEPGAPSAQSSPAEDLKPPAPSE